MEGLAPGVAAVAYCAQKLMELRFVEVGVVVHERVVV